MSWTTLLIGLIGALLVRIYIVLPKRRKRITAPTPAPRVNERSVSEKNIETLVVLGSGGHTAEMCALLKSLEMSKYRMEFVIADTDKKSKDFIATNVPQADQSKFHEIPRSREVGQSYVSSLFSTLQAFASCIRLLITTRPDLLLVNGPGTCIPVCMAAYLLRIAGVKFVKIIYVESVCRVRSLSLAARILYRFADRMFVQWPQLQHRYPHTEYIGRVF